MYSRTLFITLPVLLLLVGCAGSQPSSQETQAKQAIQPITDTDSLLKYQEQITVDYLKEHLYPFSDDSMQGRETGTQGLEMAATYLAKQYKEMGLQPVGDNNTYFQKFTLNASQSDSVVYEIFRHSNGQKELFERSVASASSSADFLRAFGGTDTLSGKIVFAGFGVDDAEHKVTHLAGADLQGKWVMVFQEIPHIVDGDTLINPAIDARARFQSILRKGATGILLVPNMSAEEFKKETEGTKATFGKPENMSLAYRDKGSGGSGGGFSKGYNVINPNLAAQLLGVDSMEAYRQQLVNDISGFEPTELEYGLTHTPYATDVTISTKNVLAFYEGADPKLKDEVVVMTSHYDHVGVGQPDSTGDRIYNGADDDGSGTVGLLNIAQAFVDAGENGVKPKRSILFLNVSAEEKGLLGSRYYSDHPVFPIEKTVTNINTDMIGRIDAEHEKKGVEDYAYIIGSEIISSDLDSLVKAANRRSGQIALNKKYNDLQDPNQFYRRSDHWHFGRKGVPFVFFFTGVHEDYHRPSDEVHKIRFEKMAKIVRTMYASAVLIANTDQPPTVDNQEFIQITQSDN